MKNIILIFAVLFCVGVSAQVPGYTNVNSRYKWIAGMFDSTFHPPLFNGTPNSLRGGSNRDGAIAIDTANHRPYLWGGAAWNRVAMYNDIALVSADSVWKVGGNSFTIDALKVIGQKNIAPLGFITGDTLRMRIDEYGINRVTAGINKVLVMDTVTKILGYMDAGSGSGLSPSDTAAMLAPYLRKFDTTTMLSGYVRSQRFLDSLTAHWTAINLRATQSALVDTAAAIRADFPSGGGSSISDSTLQWVTTNGDTTNQNTKVDTGFARVGRVNSVLTVGDTLKGTKYLWAFGTSITKGSSTEGFPTDSVYHKLFAKRYGLTVRNMGTGGATMQVPGLLGNADSAMVNACFRMPTYSSGDWWIFEFGVNDAWITICPDCDTTQFKIAYNKVLDTAINVRGITANRIILKTPIPSPSSEYYPRIANYARAVRTIAETRGTWLSDDYAYLTTYGGYANFGNNWGDSVHPNTQTGYLNMYKTLDDLQLPIKQVGELIVNGGGYIKDTFNIKGTTIIAGLQKDTSTVTGLKLLVHSGNAMVRDRLYLRNPVPTSSAVLQMSLGTSDIGYDLYNNSTTARIYTTDATRVTYTSPAGTITHTATGFTTTGAMIFDANGFQGASIGSAVVVNPTNNQYGYLQARGIAIDNLLRTNPEVSRVGINYLPTTTGDAMLTVAGRAKIDSFTMATGAVNGYVLKTDGSGNATWQAESGGGGGGGTPAGNYGNVQVNRNNTFDTPASDSLDFDGGLVVKGSLKSSTLTSGRVSYAGTGGLIQDDADFTFNGTTATIGGAYIGGDAGHGAGTAISLNGAHTTSAYTFLGLSNNLYINVPTGGSTIYRENNASTGWLFKGATLSNNAGNVASSVPFWVQTTGASNYGAIIQASASQSQNLLEFRNSSNSQIAAFNGSGEIIAPAPTYSSGGYSDLVRNTTTGRFETATKTGNYTPTITNVANVSASTAYTTNYYIVGDMVHVFGKIAIDPTLTATATTITITLPVSTAFSNDEEASGTFSCSTVAGLEGGIYATTGAGTATFSFITSDINNNTFRFHFSYKIITP